jgi:HEAT repeat protein
MPLERPTGGAGVPAARDERQFWSAFHPSPSPSKKPLDVRADQGLRLFAQATPPERVYEEKIGDTTIKVRVYARGGEKQDLIFINLHHNEKTSVQAARRVVDEVGGMVMALDHPGERLVTFQLHGKSYTFNPNGIFTDAGIEKTVRGPSIFIPEAKRAVKQFAETLLEKYVRNRRVIIAVHNNSHSFTVDLWDKNGPRARDAAEFFKGDPRHPHNFFLVTTVEDFNLLKSYGYNVVRQDNERATDDGSLSIFCGRNGIRYINSEAELGDTLGQTSMLRTMAAHSAGPHPAEGTTPSPLRAEHAATSQPKNMDAQIARLVEQLGIPGCGRTAAQALAKIGPAAIPALIGALKDRDEETQSDATRALSLMGQAAVPALMKALRDEESTVRKGAAHALTRIDPTAKEAIRALIATLENKKEDARERAKAASALGFIGHAARDAIPLLITMLRNKNEDPRVRGGVARALGRIGTAAEGAIPDLIAVLRNKKEDADVRDAAVWALGKFGSAAKDAVPLLVNELRTSKDDVTFITVALALGHIGPAAKDAVPALKRARIKGRKNFIRRISADRALENLQGYDAASRG